MKKTYVIATLLLLSSASCGSPAPSPACAFTSGPSLMFPPISTQGLVFASAVGGVDASHVWAVGQGSVGFWNGSSWAMQDSTTASKLLGVWAADATHAWAVGEDGTTVVWNGTAWSARASGTTNRLRAVWGVDSSHVWAVGDGGTILQWNGTAWAAQSSGTTNTLQALWGFDSNNVWAIGDVGTILRWNGAAWSAQDSGGRLSLAGIWGSSTTDIWVTAATSEMLRWDGSKWNAQPAMCPNAMAPCYLDGIWGSSANQIWVSGCYPTTGFVNTWNGTAWTTMNDSLSTCARLWGSDATHIWGTDEGGSIVKWNGSTLDVALDPKPRPGNRPTYVSIWAADLKNAWAVDKTPNTIWRWDGGSWNSQNSGIAEPLASVWGTDVSHVYAVGTSGSIIKWDGSAWSTVHSGGVNSAFDGAFFLDANNIWTESRSGAGLNTIYKWNGSDWSSQVPGKVTAFWGASADDVWAVGDSIMRWDGSSWKIVMDVSDQTLLGIWGCDANNIWAVGRGGVTMRWDGSTWSYQNMATSFDLNGIWGRLSGGLYAVGDKTLLNSPDGVNWRQLPISISPTGGLVTVAGSPAGDLWVGGDMGTLLHGL